MIAIQISMFVICSVLILERKTLAGKYWGGAIPEN